MKKKKKVQISMKIFDENQKKKRRRQKDKKNDETNPRIPFLKSITLKIRQRTNDSFDKS